MASIEQVEARDFQPEAEALEKPANKKPPKKALKPKASKSPKTPRVAKPPKTPKEDPPRWGVGEWFGQSFVAIGAKKRRILVYTAKRQRFLRSTTCPYQPGMVKCGKQTGVCTLRQYEKVAKRARVMIGSEGRLVTMCPKRFYQNEEIFRWVGETILKCPTPQLVKEIGFLEGIVETDSDESDHVGRIDEVLVVPNSKPLEWCALELQSVYFQGGAYSKDYDNILEAEPFELPFPGAKRQPDFRSSGPKRLMPQLQTKVPSLRRWGKKMAVVIDESFFAATALRQSQRREIRDISNADIAWFIVGYNYAASSPQLERREVFLTTLEDAVEGLTAGVPSSLGEFERRIRAKIPSPPATANAPDVERLPDD